MKVFSSITPAPALKPSSPCCKLEIQFFSYMSEAYVPHRFNPEIASLYGIPAALVYQYLWYRSVKMAEGRFVAVGLDAICKQYPYLGRKQVRLALSKLVHPGNQTPALIARKRTEAASTFQYAPISREAGERFVRFDSQIATQHGIVAALIHDHVAFRVRDRWREKAQMLYEELDPAQFDYQDDQMQCFAYTNTRKAAVHRISAKKWARLNPYVPVRTVERGFSSLLKAGLLRKPCPESRTSTWYVRPVLLNTFMRQALDDNGLQTPTAKRALLPPKGHSCRQNDTLTAKRALESNSTESGSTACGPVDKAHSEALVELRSQKLNDKANALLLSGAKATLRYAPSVLPTAEEACDAADEEDRNRKFVFPRDTENTQRALSNPDVVKTIKLLNRPGLPAVKAKVLKDSFGHPVVRKHVRKPKPEDAGWLEYLDDLTPEERESYIASFR